MFFTVLITQLGIYKSSIKPTSVKNGTLYFVTVYSALLLISHIMASNPFTWLYSILQWFLIRIFSPNPPPPGAKLHRPKIAIIGAGLTGVSAASHCVGHGFDVVLFEAEDRDHLGGIWTVS